MTGYDHWKHYKELCAYVVSPHLRDDPERLEQTQRHLDYYYKKHIAQLQTEDIAPPKG